MIKYSYFHSFIYSPIYLFIYLSISFSFISFLIYLSLLNYIVENYIVVKIQEIIRK